MLPTDVLVVVVVAAAAAAADDDDDDDDGDTGGHDFLLPLQHVSSIIIPSYSGNGHASPLVTEGDFMLPLTGTATYVEEKNKLCDIEEVSMIYDLHLIASLGIALSRHNFSRVKVICPSQN